MLATVAKENASARTILVVDDQPDIRLMCRVNLALEGYHVVEAVDGETGLAAVTAEQPDLVLLDVMMPGVDGWQVLETMKASESTHDIPVVLLTARVQREDEIRGWRSGAADYLSKPFNPSTLTEVVRRTLMRDNDEDRRRRALEKLSIL
jgi:two-component system alkaline phosphatase synthesis response regulator PhoP